MTSTSPRLRAAALLALAALALASAGCSKIGCFEYTQQEYDAVGGCPSQAEAAGYFGDQNCGYSEVESVDSEGTYEDGYCCYAISKRAEDEYYDVAPCVR